MKKLLFYFRKILVITGRKMIIFAQNNKNKVVRNMFISLYCLTYRLILPIALRLAEAGTAAMIKKSLKNNMTFVDLGANKGLFTILAAKLVGKNGRVFAFEPAPFNLMLLSKHLCRYHQVNIIAKAVSDRSSTARFFLSGSDTVTHTLFEDSKETRECIEVETTSLDEFFSDKDSHVDFIKIDVEGAEIKALEGMKEIIKRNPGLKMIIEFQPENLRVAGYEPVMLLDTLRNLGFRIQIIDDDTRALKNIADSEANEYLIKNNARKNLFCEITTSR
jgi:FkbM family methyltransferase